MQQKLIFYHLNLSRTRYNFNQNTFFILGKILHHRRAEQ
jgi:hypothetical protein